MFTEYVPTLKEATCSYDRQAVNLTYGILYPANNILQLVAIVQSFGK